MRKVWTVVILTALMIGTCCFFLFYVINVSDQASAAINKIQEDVSSGQYESAQKGSEQLDEYWKSQHTMLSIILHHEILEEIEESIALLSTTLQQPEEELSEFWFESTRTLVRIANLRDLEIPNVANIL